MIIKYSIKDFKKHKNKILKLIDSMPKVFMKAKNLLLLFFTSAISGTIKSAQGPALPNKSSDLQKQHALLKYIDPVELNNALFLQGIKRQAAALWSAILTRITKTPFASCWISILVIYVMFLLCSILSYISLSFFLNFFSSVF